MSIRVKLLVSYIAMIIIPIIFCGITVLLISFALYGDNRIMNSLLNKEDQLTVGETGKEDEDEIFSKLKTLATYAPNQLEDVAFLKETDRELNKNRAGLFIRKNGQLLYSSPYFKLAAIEESLPAFETEGQTRHFDFKIENFRFYFKQFNYYDEKNNAVSIFVLEHVNPLGETARKFFVFFVVTLVIGLIVTNGILTYFMSKSIIKPLRLLKQATERIQNGDLDFQVIPHKQDEIGELSLSFGNYLGRQPLNK